MTDDAPDGTYGDLSSIGRRALVAAVIGGLVLVVLAVVAVVFLHIFTGNGYGAASPEVSFGYDYQPSNDSVTVVHRGGDDIPLRLLNISVVGPNGARQSRAPVGGNRSDPKQFQKGDSVVLTDIEPGDTVRIVLHNPEREEPMMVKEYTVPQQTES